MPEKISGLSLWNTVIDMSEPTAQKQRKHVGFFDHFDFVTPNARSSSMRASRYVVEDNEAVIKNDLQGRSPDVRHISRTHRCDLDWLFDRINLDKAIHNKHVNTTQQIADALTKGSFSRESWTHLSHLFGLMSHRTHSCSLFMLLSSFRDGMSMLPTEFYSGHLEVKAETWSMCKNNRWTRSGEEG